MKCYTWELSHNQGKGSKEIIPLLKKEVNLKIEGRDLFQEIDMMILYQSLVKIRDQDTTGLDLLEDKMTKCVVIDCDHRISRGLQTLLDVLDASVTDVIRI